MKMISKVISLLKKLTKELYSLTKAYSFSYAFYNLLWWLSFYFRTPLSFSISTFAIQKKALWLDKYIQKNYADIIERFGKVNDVCSPIESYKIWVFWGQGEDNMPVLIKACYNQLKSNNSNVHLITTENLSEYIDIPEIILNKVFDGKISWAHFSDIIRMTLLAKYGGLWLDATVWTPGALPIDKLMTMPLFTANGVSNYTGKSIRFWTSFQWSWSGWCIGTNAKNAKLFSFVSEMLINLASKEDCLLDYVLIDYLIYYACRNFPSVSTDMANCTDSPCVYRNELASLMPKPYNEEKYKQITATDFVFKLSFRTQWQEKTPQGEETFYGKLITRNN